MVEWIAGVSEILGFDSPAQEKMEKEKTVGWRRERDNSLNNII